MSKQNVAGQWVPAELAMALVSPESDLPDQAFIDYWLKLQKHVFQPSVDIGSSKLQLLNTVLLCSTVSVRNVRTCSHQ